MEIVYLDVHSSRRNLTDDPNIHTHNNYQITLPRALRDIVHVDVEAAEIPMTMYSVHGPSPLGSPDTGTNRFTIRVRASVTDLRNHLNNPVDILGQYLYYTAVLNSGNYSGNQAAIALRAELSNQMHTIGSNQGIPGAYGGFRLHTTYRPIVTWDNELGLFLVAIINEGKGANGVNQYDTLMTVNQLAENQQQPPEAQRMIFLDLEYVLKINQKFCLSTYQKSILTMRTIILLMDKPSGRTSLQLDVLSCLILMCYT